MPTEIVVTTDCHRCEQLAVRVTELEDLMRVVHGVVTALDIVCAARALPRKLYDALSAVRNELRGIVGAALGGAK